MSKLQNALLAGAAALMFAGFAHAQAAAEGTAPAAGTAASSSSAELSEGEVRKIDRDSKKMTLKHGPLKNLDMPGMTMVFQVKDDAMLDQVQAGDKVRFRAEKIDGKMTVTHIEAER